MVYQVSVCECCGKEYKSNEQRHWSDTIHKIAFDAKDHAGVQVITEIDCCTECAKTIRNAFDNTVAMLKKEHGRLIQLDKEKKNGNT